MISDSQQCSAILRNALRCSEMLSNIQPYSAMCSNAYQFWQSRLLSILNIEVNSVFTSSVGIINSTFSIVLYQGHAVPHFDPDFKNAAFKIVDVT